MTSSYKIKPAFNWNKQIGGLQARSRIVDSGDLLFVGTCGDSWNIRDRNDGVHCLSKRSGKSVWFTSTLADTNEMVLAASDLLVPTDLGDLMVLEQKTGTIKCIYQADSAILGQPIVRQSGNRWSAIFASISGVIYSIDSNTDQLLEIGRVGSKIRSNLVPIGHSEFLIFDENGRISKASLGGETLNIELIAISPSDEYGYETSITATPLVYGDHAFVGYARSTYHESPALFCLNWRTGDITWNAKGKLNNTYGNVRTTPALIDNKLAIASSYTDSLIFIDPKTGRYLNEVALGQNVFQQWSSPALINDKILVIGRVDGVVSIIDTENYKLLSSISVKTANPEPYSPINSHSNEDGNFRLYPGEAAPVGAICCTPLVSEKYIYVGTTDGLLSSIKI